MFRQITFFKVFRVPKQRTGIFKVSNTWTILCNNMVEEKAGIEKQNSKKGFEKNEHACSWSFVGFRFHCQSIFKGGQLDKETSKLVKAQSLRQFQKWQAEIPDTPLGLTGIGILRRVLVHWLAQPCHAKWQRGSRELQHPAVIEPTSPGSLQLKLTTKPWIQIDLLKKKEQYMIMTHI